MSTSIRLAMSGDVGALRQIARDAYGHYVERLGKAPGPILDDYAKRVSDGQVWVMEGDDGLIGMLVLRDVKDGSLLVDNIAVRPSAQGKGHGLALMEYAEAEARRRDCSHVQLYTHVLMTENRLLYRRLGFHETARVTEEGFERVYMAKDLS